MFRVNTKREVLYPVTINTVKVDGSGEAEPLRIKVRYRLLSRDEMRRQLAEQMKQVSEGGDGEYAKALRRSLDDEQVKLRDSDLADHVLDWEGIVDDASGDPVPFSREVLLQLLGEYSAFSAALHEGLWSASKELPVKN